MREQQSPHPLVRTIFRLLAATALVAVVGPLALADAAQAQNQRQGVTLYDQEDFRGRSQFIDQDEPSLGFGRVGNDRTRSVRVDPGCKVVLYADSGYRGVSYWAEEDLPDLRRTPVGPDSVSSLRVDCRRTRDDRGNRGDRDDWGRDRGRDRDDGWLDAPLGRGAGAILYGDDDFRGARVRFDRDIPELSRTEVGNDRASSLQVAEGCRVTLYADSLYRGASADFDEDIDDLGRTRFGNDRASSARIECRRSTWGDADDGRDAWGGGWEGRKGVVLYSDEDFRGRSEFLYQDDDRLGNNTIGNDRVSSLRVSPGCRITLHENERYTGRSDVFERDTRSLRGSRIGNDQASSIEVRCTGQGGNTGADFGFGDGVILYADTDFRGAKQTFERDVADLRRTHFGNDRASSLRIAKGCVVTLYSDTNFRGRSVRLDQDEPNIASTGIGNDAVSSLEVDCRRRW